MTQYRRCKLSEVLQIHDENITLSWEVAGALSEVVGAVAVVISLLYLAVQIRAQVAQARLQALHEMSKQIRDVTASFARPDISEIVVKANKDFDSVSDSEIIRLIILTTNLFRAWEEAFLEMTNGHLETNAWEVLSRDYTQVLGVPSLSRVWQLRKQNYDPSFQRYVDSLDKQEYVYR